MKKFKLFSIALALAFSFNAFAGTNDDTNNDPGLYESTQSVFSATSEPVTTAWWWDRWKKKQKVACGEGFTGYEPNCTPVATATNGYTWTKCADLWGWCSGATNKVVRFGQGTTWTEATWSEDTNCHPVKFGFPDNSFYKAGDICEVRGGTVTNPDPEPEPDPVACGEGFTGFEPNCTPVVVEPVACGEGFTGFEPNCTPIPPPDPVACGEGFTGFEPNCVPVVVEPVACGEGFTGFEPNCVPVVVEPETCPDGFSGTPPNCEPYFSDNFRPYVNNSLLMTPVAGSNTYDSKPATYYPGISGGGGQFRIQCQPAKMGYIDPIVNFGVDSGHLHTFFGNAEIDQFSTNEDLVGGNSTCFGGTGNSSAYWIPSLIDTTDGRPLEPNRALFYYKTGNPGAVIAPPAGLRIVAGKASSNPSTPQGSGNWDEVEVVRWVCNEQYINNNQPSIMSCSGDLMLMVQFPSCWDGVNLDSPDHQSHMAYGGASCPASHPVLIPDITANVHWNVNGTGSLRLASDNYEGNRGGFSAHADWMNGWNPSVAQTFTDNCLKAGVDCHANLLGNGEELFYKQ